MRFGVVGGYPDFCRVSSTLLNLLTIAKALNARPAQLLAVFDNTIGTPKS
jgi:hypothetical protein